MSGPETGFEAFLDALAERVAAKVSAAIATNGSAQVRPRLLSVDQAAQYLGRTKEALQQMIAAGKIPTIRGDRRVFLDIEDLNRWIERNKIPA